MYNSFPQHPGMQGPYGQYPGNPMAAHYSAFHASIASSDSYSYLAGAARPIGAPSMQELYNIVYPPPPPPMPFGGFGVPGMPGFGGQPMMMAGPGGFGGAPGFPMMGGPSPGFGAMGFPGMGPGGRLGYFEGVEEEMPEQEGPGGLDPMLLFLLFFRNKKSDGSVGTAPAPPVAPVPPPSPPPTPPPPPPGDQRTFRRVMDEAWALWNTPNADPTRLKQLYQEAVDIAAKQNSDLSQNVDLQEAKTMLGAAKGRYAKERLTGAEQQAEYASAHQDIQSVINATGISNTAKARALNWNAWVNMQEGTAEKIRAAAQEYDQACELHETYEYRKGSRTAWGTYGQQRGLTIQQRLEAADRAHASSIREEALAANDADKLAARESRVHNDVMIGWSLYDLTIDGNPEALNATERVVQRAAQVENVSDRIKIGAFMIQGNVHMRRNNPTLALTSYQRIVDADPENYMGYAHRASALSRLRRFDETIADCNTALNKIPANVSRSWILQIRSEAREGQNPNSLPAVQQALADMREALSDARRYNAPAEQIRYLEQQVQRLEDRVRQLGGQP